MVEIRAASLFNAPRGAAAAGAVSWLRRRVDPCRVYLGHAWLPDGARHDTDHGEVGMLGKWTVSPACSSGRLKLKIRQRP